jgi:hypothetical protein
MNKKWYVPYSTDVEGDVGGQPLLRRCANSENWVVGSHEAATHEPSQNR